MRTRRELLVKSLLSILPLLTKYCYHCFTLNESPNSYAQFKKWGGGLNGSLEFEFKTDQPNGLLLYTDDGGTYDFFEVKLVEGALRLRYNLGGGAQIITVGRDLNDGHWHKVIIDRQLDRTTVTVDKQSQSKSSRGKEFNFGRFETNSDVFVGGMPPAYNNKLPLLALPSVIFEPRFVGAVRNLIYAEKEYGVPKRQEIKHKEKNTKTKLSDACEMRDPCQHGGICISTDGEPFCECRNVDYEGQYCEKTKAPAEAFFKGSEFLTYDLSQTGGGQIVSAQDSVTLYFKTRQPNGLLFFTGDGSDYLNIALKDGGILITMGLNNGKQDMQIKPNKIRFDDNQWHKLGVHRKIQEISTITSFCRLSAVIDGIYSEHSHIAGKFQMLSSSRIFVGGSINTRALAGSRIHNNFVGCMRKVEFAADTMRLHVIELAKQGSKMIQPSGKLEYKCMEADPGDPVTFLTREAHLVLPPWNAKKSGSMSLKFRTNEPNGLILYNTGIRPPRSDLFAIELLNGHIYVHLDLGSGALKIRASRKRVDDGLWHDLTLRRSGREGKVTVDGNPADFETPGESNQLELDGNLYVGGTGPVFSTFPVPAVLWTGVLKQGFVGCLKDLIVNGKPMDLANYAKHQDSGSVRASCHIHGSQCSSHPCQNGGICSEGWNRFVCDCTGTNYTGSTCGLPATSLHFNGSQYFTVQFANETKTQTEEVVLRFRTARPLALLMTTSSEATGDRVELSVAASRVRLAVRLNGRDKTLLIGRNVNDDEWHTIRYSRRASNIKLQLDNDSPLRAETILGKQSTLQIRDIHLGGLPSEEEVARMTTPMPNMIGFLQQFWFNGQAFFEEARTLGRHEYSFINAPEVKFTCEVGDRFDEDQRDMILHRPFTFKSKNTFIGLPMMKAYATIHVEFAFRTRESNGLILFNGGKKNDFLAVELVDGHVHYVFNLGEGLIRMHDNHDSPLNDNRWHTVIIRRMSSREHTMRVDDELVVAKSPGTNENLDLDGILYIGGVHKDMYEYLSKDMIQSSGGYEGCLANMELNGESPHILDDAVVQSSLVAAGCEVDIPQKCSENVCTNRGECVQLDSNYVCNCDLTSFTGPTCSQESTSFEFGLNKGIIKYMFPADKRQDITDHTIALGFQTTKLDAVLVRISSSSSKDYLEIEIVEGNVFIVYNLGNSDHPIGEIGVKVNDNAYHVIRFKRNGANSTLQIDDNNIQATNPSGDNLLHVFNSQSMIEIGGKWNKEKEHIDRPFSGIISGLVINGVKILDQILAKKDQAVIIGDVQTTSSADRNNQLQKMQQTPPASYSEVMDDLIYSGAGAVDCNADDEDECPPSNLENVTTDDLVTPVYVPATKSTSTTAKLPKLRPGNLGSVTRPECDGDDEDCAAGSGAGEIVETTAVESETTTFNQITDLVSSKKESEPILTGLTMTPLEDTTVSVAVAGSVTTTASLTDNVTIASIANETLETSHVSASHGWTRGSSVYHSHSPSVGSSTPDVEPTEPMQPAETYTHKTSYHYNLTRLTTKLTTSTSTSTTTSTTVAPPPPAPPAIPSDTIEPTYNNKYPSYVVTMKPSLKHPGRIHSEIAESIAFVIGIVASILIAIVLVIIIIVRYRPGTEPRYKMDDKSNAGVYQGPNASLLGNINSDNNIQSVQYPLNGKGQMTGGQLMGGSAAAAVRKKRDSKDVKEWYV